MCAVVRCLPRDPMDHGDYGSELPDWPRLVHSSPIGEKLPCDNHKVTPCGLRTLEK